MLTEIGLFLLGLVGGRRVRRRVARRARAIAR